MKKRYYLSMLSIYLLSLAIDCIYLTSHKSLYMFLSMTIPNFLTFGLVNLLGTYLLYKPIDKMFKRKLAPEKVAKRINHLAWHSAIWIFFVGILSGLALMISVFFFDMAAEVADMSNMPPIFFISVIPSTLFTSAILPSFITFFLIRIYNIDLKSIIFLKFQLRYPEGKNRIGQTLFLILFILCIFPILIRILDLIATSCVTLEEYSRMMDISYIETSLSDQYIYLLGAIFAVVFIPRAFTKPIYSLLGEMDKVSQGDYSTRAAIISNDEVGLLTTKFNEMLHELELSRNKQVEYSKQLEQNLEQLNREIEDRERAEELARQHQKKLFHSEKMASVGTLVSGVAHEINNPNNFILLNSDNLADVWKDLIPLLDKYAEDNGDFMVAGLNYSEIRDEISLIINGVKEGSLRIKKIVQTLKDFARKDPGNLDQEVDLAEVIDDSTTILTGLIKKNTDQFSINILENLPKIKGNIQQIEQVVINLLSNACESLENRNKAIYISTAIDDNSVSIIVRDEGKGISSEDLKYIMDPFFTTKRDSGGTGLGLSISYNIIKEHGGELSILSEPGKGTTATIKLPKEYVKI
ncbi:ATP-binding protein [Candidatus Cloacimonadota bacterium]